MGDRSLALLGDRSLALLTSAPLGRSRGHSALLSFRRFSQKPNWLSLRCCLGWVPPGHLTSQVEEESAHWHRVVLFTDRFCVCCHVTVVTSCLLSRTDLGLGDWPVHSPVCWDSWLIPLSCRDGQEVGTGLGFPGLQK